MDRPAHPSASALIILAVLGIGVAVAAMKVILVPVALALLLASILSPATRLLRRTLPVGPVGAAALLFLLLAFVGLYVASLTAESLVQAARTLPSDAERLAGQLSRRVTDLGRTHPSLRPLLPEPGTIDLLGDRNSVLLIRALRERLADLTGWVVQGFITLVLAVFLLAEGDLLGPKVIRFVARDEGDGPAADRALRSLIRQVRAYLLARTLINCGLGLVLAGAWWFQGLKFAPALGMFAALMNFIPYVGQILGGGLPVLVALLQFEAMGDALIVAAIYLGCVTVEGYVVTPYIMGRSLDLNGTTVLLACLFWGFLWGLSGLILAMPITVCMKLIFQHVPALRPWADLMSLRAGPGPIPGVLALPVIVPGKGGGDASEAGPSPGRSASA